jgi:DNA-binding winged helix-turn-helix (wHTH) protein
MTDPDDITSIPLAQTASPEGELPDGRTEFISFGPYRLLAAQRRLEQDGRLVPLGDPEFDLLCALTGRAGEIISNRELITRTWGESPVDEAKLKFHVNALRKALSTDRKIQYITKISQRGYLFAAPICRSPVRREGNPLWDGQIIDAKFYPGSIP